MDDSNRDCAGRPDQAKRPDRPKQIVLALLLALLAVMLIGHFWIARPGRSDPGQTTTEYHAFMAAVREADKIPDALQRCLRFPDLPGSHWNRETTAAYCQLRNHITLQLSDIEAMLQKKQADQIDRIFTGYLDSQLHDPRQPGKLDAAFYAAGFDKANEGTRKIIDAWKQQAPDSAFALAASGMQYLDAAQQARGDDWVINLRDDQVIGMRRQLTSAHQDLERAVALLPTLTTAYQSMIYVGALEGDDEYMNRAARRGLAVDPSNFAIRSQMMNQAQPKWGGAFGGEREQQREAEQLIERNPLLRMVVGMPDVNRLTSSDSPQESNEAAQIQSAADSNLTYLDLKYLAGEVYDGAPVLAIELYSEILRFQPRAPDVLQWHAQEMVRLGDASGAIDSLVLAARRFPDDSAIGTKLGSIYASTGHAREAEAAFLAVLQRDPNYERAMAELGDLYNHAGHQPEKAEALADLLISRYPDLPDGYILRACHQMDHNLEGRYETIHYFIDHFGDRSDFKSQVAEMRAYLASHPEQLPER